MLYTDGWLDLAKVVVPNVVNYCRKHNYRWAISRISEPYDGFTKLTGIKNIFDNNDADIVWSLDCDTLITNYTIKVDSLLDDKYDAYFCNDYNGLNAGSFIIKNSNWSDIFLGYCLNLKGLEKMYCEQDAIVGYIKDHPSETKIKILAHPSINSYLYENYPEIPTQSHEQGNWKQGDLLLHLPGINNEKRLSIINEYKLKIIYE